MTNLVNTLRVLRNICRQLTRRLHIELKSNNGIGGGGGGASSISNSLLKQSMPSEIDRDPKIWDQLITEIDIALHEFRYRKCYHDSKKKKPPPFKKRKSTFDNIMQTSAVRSDIEEGNKKF